MKKIESEKTRKTKMNKLAKHITFEGKNTNARGINKIKNCKKIPLEWLYQPVFITF